MGYYRAAGDYYRRARGDVVPSFMPGIGQVVDFLKSPAGPLIGRAALSAGKAIAKWGSGGGSTVMTPGGPQTVVAGGRSYRRMNALNPKALRRALRRAAGFERFARKVMHLTHRKTGPRFKTRFFGRKRRK